MEQDKSFDNRIYHRKHVLLYFAFIALAPPPPSEVAKAAKLQTTGGWPGALPVGRFCV